MKITDIKVRRTYTTGRLLAVVSIVIDDALAVHDIKVIEGPERLFVAMPSRKEKTCYRDIVHPIQSDVRRELEEAILAEYHRAIEEAEASGTEAALGNAAEESDIGEAVPASNTAFYDIPAEAL